MNGEEGSEQTADQAEALRLLRNAAARFMMEHRGVTLEQMLYDYRIIYHWGGGGLAAIDLIPSDRFYKESMN